MFCINDVVPNEILEKIFSKLESRSDLLHARLVCRQWLIILDELVGYPITITNFNSVIQHLSPEELQKVPKDLKSTTALAEHINMSVRHLQIGVPGILFSEALIELTEFTMDLTVGDSPHLEFPHVLKKLSCFEPISPNFFATLPTMTTLDRLEMNLFSLANLKTENLKSNSTFVGSLTTLIIPDMPAYPRFKSELVIPQLNSVLDSIQAPWLTKFDVTYPTLNLTNVNEDCTRSIMKFLLKSSRLKYLSIGIHSPSQNFLSPTKEFEYPLELQEEMKMIGKKLFLQSAALRDNHLHSLRPSCQIKSWAALLKEQRELLSLEFNLKSSIELQADVISIVRRNMTTLKKLTLACFPCEISEESKDICFVSVNCSDLSECCKLETLRVSDKLVNTNQLPSSLNRIYVDAMLTNNDVTHILLSPIQCLKQIELKDCRGGLPKGFGYGVRIETLMEFVLERKVERLYIYSGCTDGKYPANGISNGDVDRPKILRKRKPPSASLFDIPRLTPAEFEEFVLERVRIAWVKNERGYYVDGENNEDECSGEEQQNTTSSSLEEEQKEEPETGSEFRDDIKHPCYTSDYLYSSFH